MPELDGIGVVRMLRKDATPLIAFVTAYDEYAVRAFEVNAVDYLLKPVEKARLRETLNRAQERLEHAEIVAEQISHVGAAIETYEALAKPPYLERIPAYGTGKKWSSCRFIRLLDRRRRRAPAHHDSPKGAAYDCLPPQRSGASAGSLAFHQTRARHVGQRGVDHQGQHHAGRDTSRGVGQRSEATGEPAAVSVSSRTIPQALTKDLLPLSGTDLLSLWIR